VLGEKEQIGHQEMLQKGLELQERQKMWKGPEKGV